MDEKQTQTPNLDVHPQQTIKRKPYLSALKWLLLAIAFIVILFLLANPLRGKYSERYLKSGDSFLAQKKYQSADLEYRKALVLNPVNSKAKERRALVDSASADVKALKDFYKEKNLEDKLSDIDSASSFPESEYDALNLSKKLIEQKEYQLAAIPAKTATLMDPNYRDAWIYLGISNLKIAETVELPLDLQKKYSENAKEYFDKAYSIDPEYEYTKKFLAEVNKLLSS